MMPQYGQGISLPPGIGGIQAPQPPAASINELLAGMQGPGMPLTGEQRSAMNYIDAAFEMLTAAGDEVPEIAGAIQQVKDFATQTIGGALGGGMPGQLPAPAMPPQGPISY